MGDAMRPSRREGKMGSAARALALGLAIGNWPLLTGVAAASKFSAAAGVGLDTCGLGLLRVTMWGEVAPCGRLEDAAGCDETSLLRQADRVQVLVGDVRKEAGLIAEAGSLAWREEIEFGCVDARDEMVVTLYDKLTRPLASCEVGEAASVEYSLGQARVCKGAHGVQFTYSVENATNELERTRRHRGLQESPAPSATDTVAAETDAPEAETPPPTPEPDTPAPVETETEEPTDSPVTPTPAPETPATSEPVTPAPNTPETDPPVLDPTEEPTAEVTEPPTTPETPAPVTPATSEPTPRPVQAVEETPAPVDPRTDAPQLPVTPSPTAVGTTDRPIEISTTPAPQSPPTGARLETTTPVLIGTDASVAPHTTPAPQSPPTGAQLETTTPVLIGARRTTSPANVDYTPFPVESPPPVATPISTSQPTSTSPTATAPTQRDEGPTSPSASQSSAPAASSPPAPTSAETPSPTVSATPPPTTTAPAAAATLAPTPKPASDVLATLSPNTEEEQCTVECVEENKTLEEWTATYYDYRCQDLTHSELPGCNLEASNSNWINCRRCIINSEEFEAVNGEDDMGYPLCPCCEYPDVDVASVEQCTTPSPTIIEDGDQAVDLRTEANDPVVLLISFNSADCSASGLAIIAGEPQKALEVTRYSDGNGECTTDFDFIYGKECDLSYYTWDYTATSFTYEYTCDTGTPSSAGRRRLEGSSAYTFDSDTILCNNGESFVSVTNLEGDGEGLVYATSEAEGFEDVTSAQAGTSDSEYCNVDANNVSSTVLANGVENVLEEPDEESSEGSGLALEIIIPVACAVVLLLGCFLFCCYRQRKGKEGRADHMRRNLGYTPDMEAKGDGNFGPTNKHVAITRGGGPQVTPEMLATTSYRQPNYAVAHHRAPSEALSSVIEDNIANNYRPKTAAQSWQKRKEHKDLTKPAAQQHVIGGGPTAEELKAENSRTQSASARSEQLSEHSLSQLELANQTAAAQPNYGYTFEEVEEGDDDDDDARSAATGMSGPSKYAPSGYAPSSHHGGVTHDLMSQYEPSVYEADSQYDPSLYGRESEYGDESSSYSYNDAGRRGSYSGNLRHGRGNGVSGRAHSVADTAAMSHLGSVMEQDDGSAYGASESYVSSYVSSEDDDGRPARSVHPRGPHDVHAMESVSSEGGSGSGNGGVHSVHSRHSAHRSGRQQMSSGRSGFGASSAGGASTADGSGSRAYYDDDDNESADGRTPASVEELEYYSEDRRSGRASGRGAPLTNLTETDESQRW